MKGSDAECVVLVLMEMGLSFAGIVTNLLIVTAVKEDDTVLQGSTINYLLFNLCFSNLIISFLVKPISAIYIGYANSTGEWHVGLAFCALYTFTYRATWCVFPFTLVAMCWTKFLAQCKCASCGVLCCARKRAAHGQNNLPLKDSLGAATDAVWAICDLQPLTEYTMQFRRQEIRSVVGIMGISGDSGSTPTPSTNAEANHQGPQQSNGQAQTENVTNQDGNDSTKRTLGDGPTTRQKILVASIWIFSAIFALATCFPDKIFGLTLTDLVSTSNLDHIKASNSQVEVDQRELDLSYCYVKTNVNLVDYAALTVAFILPLLIGPGVVGLFQCLFAIFGLFVCRASHATPGSRVRQPRSQQRQKPNPDWTIIFGFTIILVATYPLHMYLAEVYLPDSFSFLLAKYCIGFLFVICIPILTLILRREIREGIAGVFGSAANCGPDVEVNEQQETVT